MSKFKVTLGPNMLENALLALLTRYRENYRTEFRFSVDAFWDKDEHVSVWGQRSRSQYDQRPSGRSDTELDAVHQVLISSVVDRSYCRAKRLKRLKVKAVYSASWETHLRVTGRHLPYGITQCYLPPDTSEHAPP